MAPNEVIQVLKKEAETNPVANAVFHVFAIRRRARNSITIIGLTQKMKVEGFDFDTQKYADILRLLASLGFGKLDIDSKGKVRALKEIKTTLQSIGKVACGDKESLRNFKVRNKFIDMPVRKNQDPDSPKEVHTLGLRTTQMNLALSINGKIVTIPVPKNLTTNEIALLIAGFNSKESA